MPEAVALPYLLQRVRHSAFEAVQRGAILLGAGYDGRPARAPEGKGDFAFACHPLAKSLRKAPAEIAKELKGKLGEVPGVLFDAEGAYLNAAAPPEAIVSVGVKEILLLGSQYGQLPETGTRVLVEHTSANPNGPLHVGRARNPVVGDTTARIMRKAGNAVKTEFFVNDIGKQIVTLAWAIERLSDADLQALPSKLENAGWKEEDIAPLRNLATQGTERGKEDHALVRFYQAGSAMAELEGAVEHEISAWVQAIERGDQEALKRVRGAAERVLVGVKQSLERLGVAFDSFAWESHFILNGAVFEVIERLKKLPDALQHEGAYYLDIEHKGAGGAAARYFFVRADGTSLYATRDIAYHLDKARRCDRGVNVLGEDQKLAAEQVAAALKLLGSTFVPECLFYSFVSLPEGKMSTRRGRVVSLDDLLDESVELALAEVTKRRPELPESERNKIAQAVGIGAVRFNIVRVQAEKGIVFRWEEALNFEGSSAPFVQYAHARACSILRKAGQADLIDAPEKASLLLVEPWLLAEEPSCVALARTLERLPLVIEESAASVRPHPMATYALEAASAFNEFYRDVPVIGSDAAEGSRVALVAASRAALESILNLLAVAPLREM